MRLVAIENVADGMTLAQEIPSVAPGGMPMLRVGARLSPQLAGKLAQRAVRGVWVQDELGDGITPVLPLTARTRASVEAAHAACARAASEALAQNARVPDRAWRELRQAAKAALDELLDCPEVAVAFEDLARADSYSSSHAVGVLTLGLLLALRVMREDGWLDWQRNRHYDFTDERMAALGMGLLIHDIGKATLPTALLSKTCGLTKEDLALIRTHPQAGVDLVPKGGRVHPLTIAVIRSHHERFDGSGYPRGKQGSSIHLFARVAAVANRYDNITAEHHGLHANPPHIGVKAVTEGAGTEFDPAIVAHFKRLVMPYPVGHQITLPDGRKAVVVSVNPDNPECPTVRYRHHDKRLIETRMRIADGVVLDGYDDGS